MKRNSSGRSAPLLKPFRNYHTAFSKTYKRNIPFVLLIQIGKFLETYDESAKIISEQLSMKLGQKGDADWAGFPIGSAETHVQTLTEKGFAVIRMIQTENEETKKQRTGSSSSSKANRVFLPAETICIRSDKPLVVIQGKTVLFYFAKTNTYLQFAAENVDELICKLMEQDPCEIIISSMATFIKSIRHLFPQCYIRQYFELGFSPIHTLHKYFSILGQSKLLETLQEKHQHNIPTVRLDARTTINLTLFDKKKSLVDTMSQKMTKEAKTYLRKMLYNPLADKEAIIDKQDRIKKLMENSFLDSLIQNKPKKNTLSTTRHPLFKTKPNEFVTTEDNVKKFTDIINKTIIEIQLWQKWIQTLRTSGVAVFVLFPDMPDIIIGKDKDDNDDLIEELQRFNRNHSFEATIVKSGLYKHLFETDIKNEPLVRQYSLLKVQSKTQKVIRFDSQDIQRARLACSDLLVRKVIKKADQIKIWIQKFQNNFDPEFFEQFAQIECYVALAYYFKYNQQTISWPVIMNEVSVQGMEIPLDMTHIKDWVRNDFQDHFMILKGSNGSGKTSYIRTLAINLLMAHCGFPVFAQSFKTKILDALFMRLGSSDCLAEGKSSFSVEMEHMDIIAKSMTEHSAVFIDELGCSCDAESGKKICNYFIKKILERDSLCIFSTHFDITTDVTKEMGMDDDGYTFRIQPFGKNESNQNAIFVAEHCGFPSNVLYFAERLLL